MNEDTYEKNNRDSKKEEPNFSPLYGIGGLVGLAFGAKLGWGVGAHLINYVHNIVQNPDAYELFVKNHPLITKVAASYSAALGSSAIFGTCGRTIDNLFGND